MLIHLENNIDKYNQERICQVEEKPFLYWLDALSVGQRSWYREVDRGQNHHAGDVHSDDQVIFGVASDVVGGLVDDVNENCGKIGHHKDTEKPIF